MFHLLRRAHVHRSAFRLQPVRNFWGKNSGESDKFDVEKDYYKEMNASKNVDKKTLKNMYHKLCFEYHPDRASVMHQDKFKKINEAYQVLGDEKIRKDYDEARLDFAAYEKEQKKSKASQPKYEQSN